jgi:hypothetical protein
MISKKTSFLLLVVLVFGTAFSLRPWPPGTISAAPMTTSEEEALRAFAALRPIDAHVHVFKTAREFQAMLEQEQLTLLDVLVVDDTWAPRNQLQPQIDEAWKLARSSKGHVFLCTTFEGYKFNSSTFVEDSLRQSNSDFQRGAIAVKIWKTFGMEIKNNKGK